MGKIKTLTSKLHLRLKKLPLEQKQGLRLMMIGVFLIIVFGWWKMHQVRKLAFSDQFEAKQSTAIKVVEINFPELKNKLTVNEATITDGTWEVSESGVSHWSNSANPGENGNIVIYGHNKRSLFGPIRWLNNGAIIELINENGKIYQYEVTENLITDPKNIKYVLPKSKERLTLYTCTGFLSKDRYIVIAKPIK